MEPTFLTKVTDLLLDVICVVDADGHFVFVSKACERVFGYTQQELLGRNMIELVWPADRERTLRAAAEIMAGEPKTHFENRYVRKDGRVVDIMWSACWSESDRIRMAVARDITDLKRTARLKEAFYEISEAAHAAAGLPALCAQVHRVITELLPADNFAVALYEAATDSVSYPYFVDLRQPTPTPHPLEPATPIAEVIRGGQAVLRNAGPEDGAARRETSAGDGADWLGAPLLAAGCGVIGAVVVKSYFPNVRYAAEDRELLQFVCAQVASVIERQQAQARLQHLAGHDPLTDLPNRRLFHDRLETALQRARRDREPLALLCLDLNGFKQVNDAFGHALGDQLLCQSAQRLAQCVRAMDTVARMGGDEFAVLLPHVNAPDCVATVVEKLRCAIAAPFEIDGQRLNVSVSIGAAVYPQDGDTQEQLFRRADDRMYRLKPRASRGAASGG